MAPAKRPPPPPFSTFGWSLTGALLLALSLPPLGVYPLAWVALVPLIARWAQRPPSWDHIRELYALLLTTSCCVGFWLLFNPDPGVAALGGMSLFLAPIPLVVAFGVAGVVKEKVGLVGGLVALCLNILAAEFLTLAFNVSVPWLLFGHTQADAVEFIQIADLGGVLLLSLWVLLLNLTAFMAIPRTGKLIESIGERGGAMAVFTVLVVLPVAYGSVRTAQSDVPSGFTHVGIVQPGVEPGDWDRMGPATKVDHLADLSTPLMEQRRQAQNASDSTVAEGPHHTVGLLIWPQTSLPFMGTDEGEAQLYSRLQSWAARHDVALLTGAKTAPEGVDRAHGQPRDSDLANSAVLIRPGAPLVRYDQMRRVPFADAAAATGSDRVLFEAEEAEIATAVGFESLYGDHIRRFTRDGADMIVVLSRNDMWGRSAGLYQHLQFTRLRAIESRRAVVLSTVSGISALIHPGGRIEELAGWLDEEVLAVPVPTYRGETFYVRHGDWIGRWAFGLALIFNLGAIGLSIFAPELLPAKTPAPGARRRVPILG